jgi:queuosine precursor transporter
VPVRDVQAAEEGDLVTRAIGLTAAVLFVGTVVLANWLVTRFGVVDVGFGLQAPAAVFAVGLAFTLRDIVHQAFGWETAFGCVLAGCALSLIVSPLFAFASAIGFLLSELSDLAVFSALERRVLLALVVSNLVGLTVDSLVFLLVAFGNLDFLAGQIVGKALMTALAIPLILGARAFLPRHA